MKKLYSSLQEAEDKFQSETEMLRHTHQVEVSHAASEVRHYEHVSAPALTEILQISKRKEEESRLHTAMQAAAHDASKELQSKNKRIQQMEKKVGYPRKYKLVNLIQTFTTDSIAAQ